MYGGTPFHGEFSSADASALSESASRISLLSPAGTVPAAALGASDVVVIQDVLIDFTGVTARTIQVYDGSDNVVDAGERIVEATLAQNQHESFKMATPFFCKKNTVPKVKASGAGQVVVVIRGEIVRAAT